jgi:hypothetical protein
VVLPAENADDGSRLYGEARDRPQRTTRLAPTSDALLQLSLNVSVPDPAHGAVPDAVVTSWLVGERTLEDCYTFLRDVKHRLLPDTRPQLTTDGLNLYPTVVDALWRNSIDYAVMQKQYGGGDEDHRYSPAVCTGIDIRVIAGNPDADKISTSYVERQNLTMRMGMRRFTRLTNAFSKKVENHAHTISLHFMHYNFCRPHQTLTKAAGGKTTTPAMAAGITRYPWSLTQLAEPLD